LEEFEFNSKKKNEGKFCDFKILIIEKEISLGSSSQNKNAVFKENK